MVEVKGNGAPLIGGGNLVPHAIVTKQDEILAKIAQFAPSVAAHADARAARIAYEAGLISQASAERVAFDAPVLGGVVAGLAIENPAA
jgi:hypothetical protein